MSDQTPNSYPTALDSPPPSNTSPRTLIDLPTDVIIVIARHGDERAIWALRGTHRNMVEAADMALKPYLAEQTVVCRPRFMVTIQPLIYTAYDAIDSAAYAKGTIADDSDFRASDLAKVNIRFEQHLSTFPITRQLLRKLTVELNDYDTHNGWRHIRAFLPQLNHLGIYAFHHMGPYNSERDRHAVSSAVTQRWAELFVSLSTDYLPNLTTLHLDCSAVALCHLRQIAPYIPNLQELRLGNHWADCNWYVSQYDFQGRSTVQHLSVGPGPIREAKREAEERSGSDGRRVKWKDDRVTLDHLRKVFLTGGVETIRDALCFLRANSKDVRRLTVNIPDHFHRIIPPHPIDGQSLAYYTSPLCRIGSILDAWKSLEHVVLLGPGSANIWLGYEMFQFNFRDQCLRENAITSLTLEGNRSSCKSYKYHFLDPTHRDLALLPMLECLTWIEPRRQESTAPDRDSGVCHDGEEREYGCGPLYHEQGLRRLFDTYVTLRQVQWVSDYHLDPFPTDDPSTRAERNVTCVIFRPEDPAHPLQPIYPSSELYSIATASPPLVRYTS